MSMCLLNSLRPHVFFMLVCFLFVLNNKSWFSFRYIHCLCTLEENAPNTINLEAFMLTMTLSNGNIFRVTIPLWGESTGHRWILHHKTQWRGALVISLICAWTNNTDAGDVRRHRAHYDVTVMQRWMGIRSIIRSVSYVYESKAKQKQSHFILYSVTVNLGVVTCLERQFKGR